ncbi:unnamed protein product [Cyclocybe aegerita]|uniref:Uncharacterized protein n=1 Tax=Cyclocybe aegerita TaxID=1973307 RepID=A0A8S0W499_CYCAE|nr:unnamed protein product [Cyclocybe aegerita]
MGRLQASTEDGRRVAMTASRVTNRVYEDEELSSEATAQQARTLVKLSSSRITAQAARLYEKVIITTHHDVPRLTLPLPQFLILNNVYPGIHQPCLHIDLVATTSYPGRRRQRETLAERYLLRLVLVRLGSSSRVMAMVEEVVLERAEAETARADAEEDITNLHDSDTYLQVSQDVSIKRKSQISEVIPIRVATDHWTLNVERLPIVERLNTSYPSTTITELILLANSLNTFIGGTTHMAFLRTSGSGSEDLYEGRHQRGSRCDSTTDLHSSLVPPATLDDHQPCRTAFDRFQHVLNIYFVPTPSYESYLHKQRHGIGTAPTKAAHTDNRE